MMNITCNTGVTGVIEVEIYETGQKIIISLNKTMADQKDVRERPVIITAAEYERYKCQ